MLAAVYSARYRSGVLNFNHVDQVNNFENSGGPQSRLSFFLINTIKNISHV